MVDAAFYAALTAQIGSLKTYPVLATKNAVAPFLVYQRVSTTRERTMSGDAGRLVSIYRVDVYHQQLLQAATIAQAITTGLSGHSDETIRYMAIETEQDASDISGDPTLYRWIIEVRVVHN